LIVEPSVPFFFHFLVVRLLSTDVIILGLFSFTFFGLGLILVFEIQAANVATVLFLAGLRLLLVSLLLHVDIFFALLS